MILVVAEKPSVGKLIADVLGGGYKKNGYIENKQYIITWCLGHLVGLAEPCFYNPKWGGKPWKFENLPMIPRDWRLVENKSSKAQLKIVKELMLRNDVTELICATDAGREGECIFRYVYYFVKCQKPVKRLWTSSLEEGAIKKAFSELKSDRDYDNLFMAGYARAKADWLVGMNATQLFSVRYKTLLSVGRVQTPTLAMIVERNAKIAGFKKEEYYTVDIDCGDFIAVSERIDYERDAESLTYRCDGESAMVSDIDRTEKKQNPPKLYDLTSLQRDANRIFGFTAKQALDFTQSLYEKRIVTYPRTDSQYLTEDMEDTALEIIDIIKSIFNIFAEYADENPDIKRCINNKKVSDHYAIIPTKFLKDFNLSTLSKGEQNIFLLICTRLLVATSKPYIYDSVKITVECENHDFYTRGTIVKQDGFKKLDKIIKSKMKNSQSEQEEEDPIYEGIAVKLYPSVSAKKTVHYTTPPKQYTDDTLLAAMEIAGNSDYVEDSDIEKKGLGTPATRAAIIETLEKREYIKRERKNLVPTEKGINLISVVPEEIKSPKMTAEWESVLQNVEKGNITSREFTNSITDFVIKLVAKYSSYDTQSNLNFRQDSIGICPKCGKRILIFSKSYSCESGKNGCGFVIWKNMAHKDIPPAQVKKLLSKGKTDLIKGFESRQGEKFEAHLVFDENYAVKFKLKRQRQN